MRRPAVLQFAKVLCVICVLCIGGFSLDRDAFTFVAYNLHARVAPSAHSLSVEGRVTLRNDSPNAQKNLALQISSTLDWRSVRVGGGEVMYVTQPYQSDVDHTGAVTEAVITLPAAIGPKETVEVEVSYGGNIPAGSTRLTRIGTPEPVALEHDWDRISAEFTAVRGVGYVCWYPVSMQPANLSEGNRYFDVLGEWKRRNATGTMRLSVEVAGGGNSIANGRLVSTRAHSALDPEQVATRENEYTFSPIGIYAPTFVVGDFTTLDRPSIMISYAADHRSAAESFAYAAEKVQPIVTDVFGPEREKVRVIELTDARATPFDSGAMVFTPLSSGDSKRVEVEIAHHIAHASLPPARPWIGEGLAQFAQALVRERQDGRKGALAWMNGFIPALVSAEEQALSPEAQGSEQKEQQPQKSPLQNAPAPSSKVAAGESLVRATDPAYYGIKAMFVWWMLRDMIGNDALERAVRAYDPDQDKQAATMQHLIEAQSKKDLEWFFDDWVYRDRGLPDFKIDAAFARAMISSESTENPAVSVTLTVANLGGAGAEVPVTVHTDKGDVSARVLVKAKSKAVLRLQAPAQPISATVNDGSIPEGDVSNNVYLFGTAQ